MGLEWYIVDTNLDRLEGPFEVSRIPGTDRMDYSEVRGAAVKRARAGRCVAIAGYRPGGEVSYLWPRSSVPRLRPHWYEPRVDYDRRPRPIALTEDEMFVLRTGHTTGDVVWSLVREDEPFQGDLPKRVSKPKLRQIPISDADWDRLGVLGNGNHTLGLRRLIYPCLQKREEKTVDPNARVFAVYADEVPSLRVMGDWPSTVAWAVRELSPAPWIDPKDGKIIRIPISVSDEDFARLVLYGFGDPSLGLRRLLVALT